MIVKILNFLWQAIVLLGVTWLTYHYIGRVHIPARREMSGPFVLLVSLSCAFTWVNVFKWGTTRPFTCEKCMTGWFALLFAYFFHTHYWYLYLPIGLFVGAMYSVIKMRWL